MYFTSLSFIWHLLSPNWSIIRGTAQGVFKHSEEFQNRPHFPLIRAFSNMLQTLQRLPVPRIIDRFMRKRCQKRVKMWTAIFCKRVFQKYLLYMKGRLSKYRSVNKYIYYTPDGLFWLNLYKGMQLQDKSLRNF